MGLNKKEAEIIRLLKSLERKYKSKRRIRNYEFVPGLLFEIFSTGYQIMDAVEFVDRLEKKYVDWNEVRVTPLKVLQKDLDMDIDDLEFLSYVKCVLQSMFRKLGSFSISNFTECDPEECLEKLVETGIESEIAAKALVTYLDIPVMPLPDEVLRMLKKIGIFSNKASRSRVRSFFTKMGEAESFDIYKTYRLLQEHADRICYVKNPECKQCFISTKCKYNGKK